MTDLLVIANGRFQRGRNGRRWDRVEVRLRELFGNGVEIRFSSGKGDATRYAREALVAGVGWLAAAGGDGTINEVVNGYFEKDRNIQPKSPLSFLPCGSGNDWVRTLGLPIDLLKAVEALAHASPHLVDVGHVRYQGLDGTVEERIFLNIAEAGVGGRMTAGKGVAGWLPSGRLGYHLGSLATALMHRPQCLQLVIDGTTGLATGPILSLIVAGGRYFGGGMHCAPMARPDDGLLETITLGDFGWAEILLKIGSFFSGSYLDDSKVTHRSVHSLEAIGGSMVYLELDGELAGTLPATFTVLRHSLQLRY
jgi:diacylglycerol kinase (ATP)